jgi:hypothetical protein
MSGPLVYYRNILVFWYPAKGGGTVIEHRDQRRWEPGSNPGKEFKMLLLFFPSFQAKDQDDQERHSVLHTSLMPPSIAPSRCFVWEGNKGPGSTTMVMVIDHERP